MADNLTALVARAQGLADLQEKMDQVNRPESHRPMINCLRACADAITAQAAELALARECIANLEEMQARDEAALAAAEARVAVLEGALWFADDTFRDLGWHAKWEVTSAALARGAA